MVNAFEWSDFFQGRCLIAGMNGQTKLCGPVHSMGHTANVIANRDRFDESPFRPKTFIIKFWTKVHTKATCIHLCTYVSEFRFVIDNNVGFRYFRAIKGHKYKIQKINVN
jgi:hypothetical protein